MINGFWEFGWVALVAFVFVNILWVWIFTDTNLPGIENEVRADRKLEEGILIEGARLATPEIKKRIPVLTGS